MQAQNWTVIAAGSLLLATGLAAGQAPKDRGKDLTGIWLAATYTLDGKAATAADLKKVRLIIAGGKFKAQNAGETFLAGTIKLGPDKSPRAMDLTLYDLKSGKPVEMVGGYDEFSDRSYPDYLGGTSRQRYRRDLLRRAMEAEGFTVYEAEWWHFDYKDWRKYRIGNLSFEEIAVGKKE